MTTNRTFFVTGALGCLGAWTLYHLVQRGQRVISFDLQTAGHRVDMLLSSEEKEKVTFTSGDVTDLAQLTEAFKTYGVTHVIHLAALQVPQCRANPVLGSQVNVTGTVNVFEAARAVGIPHIAYASSIAVYGNASIYPPGLIAHEALPAPTTHYGVYKVANEGTARVYWNDHQISSTAFRPYTIYGLGRDQGLTSDPTKAMQAAAKGQDFHINFGGKMQMQWASDVAQQFIDSAIQPLKGAFAFNLGGRVVSVEEVAGQIETLKPGVKVTYGENPLPFPEGFDDSELRKHFETVYETPLEEGIQRTLEAFSALN